MPDTSEQHPREPGVPADPEQDENGGALTRRDFTARVGMGAVGACYAAAIGYPVYRYLASPALEAEAMAAVTELSYDLAQLPPAGAGKVFAFGAAKVLVIHYLSGEVKAFSAVCTHLGCTVEYQPDQERIHCACHQGVYDMDTGRNVAGPPPTPLRPYYIELTGDGFVIRRDPKTETQEQE